jgi:5'-3' exonuclease
MGVPGFFSWILRHTSSNNIIHKILKANVDGLYIDANCLFHPVCNKILEKGIIDNLEEKMILEIIHFIENLVSFVKPKKVFIAVDGVAPMAKIIQQRKRRFKAVFDNSLKNKIKKKYMEVNESWTNMSITPGTEFMEKLHQALLHSFPTYEYSSYHEPSEGEHKILYKIKKCKDDEVSVVYGLDADLFFLMFASNKKQIYLLREKDRTDILQYISIDDTIKKILNIVECDENFINDFIFICYLLGNDFIPNLPSIDIRRGGLDILIELYKENYKKYGNIINTDKKINNESFYNLLLKIYKNERSIIMDTQIEKEKHCFESNKMKKELWKLENLKTFKIFDPIKICEDNWEQRYYNFYFHQLDTSFINKICDEYLKGLVWILHYYFNGVVSWDWYYPYQSSPCLKDLVIYMKNIDMNNYKFKLSEPLKPLQQLMLVIPPQCAHLLPKNYQTLITTDESPIISMYPIKIDLDMYNKEMLWQCIPILPTLDINKVLLEIKGKILTKNEKIRNT